MICTYIYLKGAILHNWTFNGEPFLELEDTSFQGFVYLITNNLSGRRYIGRKYFWSLRKKRKTKKNPSTRRQRSESDWKDYWSSSDYVHADIKEFGIENFTREILMICKTRGDCNRIETMLLWENRVLETDDFYNETVGNFRKSSEKIIEARIYSKNFKTLLG